MKKSLLSGRRRWFVAGAAGALVLGSAAVATAAIADDDVESSTGASTEINEVDDGDDRAEGSVPKNPEISPAKAAEAAQAKVDKGIVTSLELGTKDKAAVWSVEVASRDAEHEVLVDGADGSVRAHESESEGDSDDWSEAKREAKAASIDLADAVDTATAEVDGTVTGVELDEHDGKVVWDVDVADSDATTHEVAVDAAKGSVIDTRNGDDGSDDGDDDDGDGNDSDDDNDD